MTAAERPGTKRSAYLDALRVLAAFFVIVNHTNSRIFMRSTPDNGVWYASMLWYYLSKTAVPLFVMISGACLLDRRDGYRTAARRVARMLIVLLGFSYAYFLYDAWVYYGLWPRAADLGAFFTLVWGREITDSFWYLYLYLGLLVMLPLMQRLRQGMNKRDMLYLAGVSFGVNALWPLIVHYVPALELNAHFDLPMFGIFIGLFFAGSYVRRYVRPTRGVTVAAAGAAAASLGLSLWLTWLEYARTGGERYWFMDERTQPSILIVLCAVSLMVAAKGCLNGREGERTKRALAELSGCTLTVYLLQDWLIAQTENRLYLPLSGLMPPFAAMLLWEAGLFIALTAAAWLLRRTPLLKKIL